jgi:putative DNA primase/helicase
MTGGDGIPARPLYHDPMTITPRHLCVLATNHMPELSVVLPAMVQRLVVVPFPVTFVDLLPDEPPSRYRRQMDAGLKARLAANLEGVLRWLVEGAVEWYALPGGLRREAPEQVLEHGRRYFEEQDRLGAFISQHCRLGKDLAVPTSDLLAAYNAANEDAKLGTKTCPPPPSSNKTLSDGLRFLPPPPLRDPKKGV